MNSIEVYTMRHFTTCIVSIIAFVIMTFFAVPAHTDGHPAKLVCDIWPPYQMQDGREVTGFSAEMVHAVFEQMNAPVDRTQAFPWQRALRILQSGHADALFSANHTADRKTFAYYPDEMLFESPWVVWTRGLRNVKTLNDLKGMTVGVVMGYSYTDEFWTFIETYCKVEKVTTDQTNFKKLALGRVDAIVAEYGNGLHILNEIGSQGIIPHHDIVIKKDGLYIIFSRDRISESFVQRFSDELKRFKTTPEYVELRKKYLEAPETP